MLIVSVKELLMGVVKSSWGILNGESSCWIKGSMFLLLCSGVKVIFCCIFEIFRLIVGVLIWMSLVGL